MNLASLSQDLYGFAIELRQVAYSMPGGHEDPLVRLSERMIHYAQEEAATSIRSPDRRGLLAERRRYILLRNSGQYEAVAAPMTVPAPLVLSPSVFCTSSTVWAMVSPPAQSAHTACPTLIMVWSLPLGQLSPR